MAHLFWSSGWAPDSACLYHSSSYRSSPFCCPCKWWGERGRDIKAASLLLQSLTIRDVGGRQGEWGKQEQQCQESWVWERSGLHRQPPSLHATCPDASVLSTLRHPHCLSLSTGSFSAAFQTGLTGFRRSHWLLACPSPFPASTL